MILIYEDMYFRHKHGLTTVAVLFKDAADAWLKELRAEVRAGARNERTVIDYEPVVERYLKPYFGSKAMDTIKASDIALDLSRFCSGQVLMLSGFSFEGHGAFPAQC